MRAVSLTRTRDAYAAFAYARYLSRKLISNFVGIFMLWIRRIISASPWTTRQNGGHRELQFEVSAHTPLLIGYNASRFNGANN